MPEPSSDPADGASPLDDAAQQAKIRRQAASIAIALVPFGLAFGIACTEAGLSVWQAMGFSTLVFTGSAQFAAVTVLGDGGTVAAAVGAGMLLNLRSLAFGMVMAPALRGPVWFRAAASQILIDESTAVGSAQPTPKLARYGFLAGGLSVFVLWNLSTFVGAAALSSAGDVVANFGLDATIPAAFLALVWPRLAQPAMRLAAAIGAVVAVASVPFVPVGVPILFSAVGALATRPWAAR